VPVNERITMPANAASSSAFLLATPPALGWSVPALDDEQALETKLLSLACMTVPVGPYEYKLYLFPGLIPYLGRNARGICDSTKHRICVSDAIPPAARLSTFWHEVAHAWFFETRENPCRPMSNEEFARFTGIVMAQIGSLFLAEIERFLKIDRRADQ